MDLLNSAIEAELDADYRLAIKCYTRLSRRGSVLDRVGIYQALARCYEKLGSFRKAAYWHEKVGQGYMKLPTAVMGKSERAYYGMVEFRAAIQDYAPNLARRTAVQSYLKALAICLKPGKEGYSHEMLFAAHLCAKLREFKTAAAYFEDTAKQFETEKQVDLAKETYALAAQFYDKAGSAGLARRLHAKSG
jgi:tetratricopeptide (TPR) repeat protein